MRITEEEYAEIVKRLNKLQQPFGNEQEPWQQEAPQHKPKRPKYRNKRVYVYEDGYVSESDKDAAHGAVLKHYDSIREYSRAQELKQLERIGAISQLKTQHSLVIQEAFIDSEGYKEKAITYRADFSYVENGKQVIEDVKGYDKKRDKFITTPVFRLKWKLLKKRYPEYTFRIY